jgi:hypothetical protein
MRLSMVVVACSVLFWVVSLVPVAHGGDPKPELSEVTLKILSGATKVECFRLDPQTEKGEGKAVQRIDGYPIIATGQEQGAEFAGKLAAALKDAKSYGVPAKCFFPGVAFRVWKDKQSVEVVICFMCSNFYTITRDADGKEVSRSELAGFQKNWAVFVELAKAAFPNDPAIQKLEGKDKRSANAKSGR